MDRIIRAFLGERSPPFFGNSAERKFSNPKNPDGASGKSQQADFVHFLDLNRNFCGRNESKDFDQKLDTRFGNRGKDGGGRDVKDGDGGGGEVVGKVTEKSVLGAAIGKLTLEEVGGAFGKSGLEEVDEWMEKLTLEEQGGEVKMLAMEEVEIEMDMVRVEVIGEVIVAEEEKEEEEDEEEKEVEVTDFDVIGKLGQGSYGSVFSAFWTKAMIPCAIKKMNKNTIKKQGKVKLITRHH